MSTDQGQTVHEGRLGCAIPGRCWHWNLPAISKVTSTDQRMTIHGRICTGVASRSVQKKTSIRSLPSGSPTSTYRRATGGNLGMYYRRRVREAPELFPLPPVPVHLYGFPWSIRVLCPALQAPLAFPLDGFGTACARGVHV